MNWNQPICDKCWDERNPDRLPVRIKPEYAEEKTCAYCGEPTKSGIFVRAHPLSVPHPAPDDD